MKRIKCFFVLIIIFFVTGCSSYDMSMKIGKDKSMEYSVTILSDYFDDNFVSNINFYKEEYSKYGYFVQEYNQDNKYGMIISKKFDNIDDISLAKTENEYNLLYLYTNGYDSDIESSMFAIRKGFSVNAYTANFYVDLSNSGIDLSDTLVTYSVTLPNGSISNNANLVSEDGTKLTWNITSLEKTEIDYVFELKSYDNFYYIVAILIAICLFFAIVITLFGKKDNEKNNDYSPYGSKNDDKEKNNNVVNNVDNNFNNVKNQTEVNETKENNNFTNNVNNSVNNNVTMVNDDVANIMPVIDTIPIENSDTNVEGVNQDMMDVNNNSTPVIRVNSKSVVVDTNKKDE